MKRILILGILVSAMFYSNAQVIPNAGFENWDSAFMYDNPTGYSTTNIYLYPLAGNVMKQYPAFSGNYSAWLETTNIMGSPMFAFMMYGDPSALVGGGGGTLTSIKGGFPYSQKPDSFVFYARHQCSHSDSALAIVILKKTYLGQSIPFSFTTFRMGGTQNTVKRYAFALVDTLVPLPLTPDSAIIAFTSSDIFNQDSMSIGNWLEVDKISFKKKSGAPMNPIPNNDFESWDAVNSVEPQDWMTTNQFDLYLNRPLGVIPVTPGKTGKLAVKITSNVMDFGGPEPSDTFGILALGNQNSDNPGMGLVDNPDSLGFWYKYSNSKNLKDSAYAVVTFSRYNSSTQQTVQLDSSAFALGAAANFTYKTLKFPKVYGKGPDTIGLFFSSSKFTPTGRGVGNYLIVDDVVLWSHFVGIPISLNNQENGFVYPNPAKESINVQFELNKPSEITISLVDLSGRKIKSGDYTLTKGKQSVKIDIQDVTDGQYLVVIAQGDNQIYSRKVVVRK
jgi:hypothetical protein